MRKLLLIGILLLGLAELAYGMWIPAKALLSQHLLASAWQQSLEHHKPIKPWSWADTWPVLKLSHGDEQFYVLNNASGQSMAFGPAHMQASPLPGISGNTIISAHRDTHFSYLKDVNAGEHLTLENWHGQTFEYEIGGIEIVDSRTTRLHTESDDDLLTLVTCYPFDQITAGGPLRYVVTARRI